MSRALVFRLGSALERWHIALVLCWWHQLTLLLLLLENVIFYGVYPLAYGQFYVFTFAIFIAFAPVRGFGSAFAGVAVVFSANLFVVCEQVAFKLNGVHTRPSMVEQSMELRTLVIVLGSFFAELDAVFYANLAGLLTSTFVVLRWARASRDRKILLPPAHFGSRSVKRYWFHKFGLLWLIGCLLNASYFLLLLATRESTGQMPHPCVEFLSDLAYGSHAFYDVSTFAAQLDRMAHDTLAHTVTSSPPKNSVLHPKLVDAPIFGHQSIPLRERTWMAEIRAAIHADRSSNRPLVVVSVVLESSGATNVFPNREKDGIFDPTLTPTLAALQAQGGIVFSRHHDYYPSTTRSHVPMFTGGPTMTMGSLSDQLSHKYEGPTLLKWIKERGARTGLFAASDLSFENLATWYRNLGFDRFHHYGIADEAFKKANALNSWGGQRPHHL